MQHPFVWHSREVQLLSLSRTEHRSRRQGNWPTQHPLEAISYLSRRYRRYHRKRVHDLAALPASELCGHLLLRATQDPSDRCVKCFLQGNEHDSPRFATRFRRDTSSSQNVMDKSVPHPSTPPWWSAGDDASLQQVVHDITHVVCMSCRRYAFVFAA